MLSTTASNPANRGVLLIGISYGAALPASGTERPEAATAANATGIGWVASAEREVCLPEGAGGGVVAAKHSAPPASHGTFTASAELLRHRFLRWMVTAWLWGGLRDDSPSLEQIVE